MQKKPTDELMEQLTDSDSLERYLKENKPYFVDLSLAELLNKKLKEHEKEKSAVIKAAEINEIYAYQIFSGKRIPSRDKLLCLLFGLELSVSEVQEFLKMTGHAPLYPKNVRDTIILSGLQNSLTVVQVNELLYDHGEKTLS